MSALPPIATAKADFPQNSCPLYPRKRTCAAQYLMSAFQKRTSKIGLFDYFVGTGEQRRRNYEAEHVGGLQIDDQLELGRPQDWHVGRLFSLQDATGKNAGLADQVSVIRSVAHQPARFGIVAERKDRRHCVTRR